MAQHGQIVAILPRSFCNGPYYRGFRDYILEHAAIHRIHLFNSRKKVFRDDEVLQENVIFLLERGVDQGEVTVSLSTDDSFRDLVEFTYPFDRIVFSDDGEKFIHVPTSPQRNPIETSPQFTNALDDIGVKVSTGAVIGFRVKEHLRDMPTPTSAPLIYPAHFDNYLLTWPLADIRKPNAIENNDLTKRWLYPTGFYCVVRRFSAKEEKKRIVASVVDPDNFGNATLVGFENHLNVFHFDKRGLSKTLAWGLTVFLNATCVDNYFRRFSGHTQVNATDLRLLKYPSRAALQQLGEWAERQCPLTQEKIDARMAQLIAGDNYA